MLELFLVLLGAAIGFGLERGYEWLRPRVLLHRLRFVLPISELSDTVVHVRPSAETLLAAGMGGKSKRAYMTMGTATALQLISATFHRLPVSLHINLDDLDTSDNAGWILLGLSRGKSKISHTILDRITTQSGIVVVKPIGAHQFFRDGAGREYHCEHVADEAFVSRVAKDFGLIYRTVLDSEVSVLLCGGIHMFGTQAAVEVALSDAFMERVRSSGAREFAQLVEVRVKEDGIHIEAESIRWRDLPFVPRPPYRTHGAAA